MQKTVLIVEDEFLIAMDLKQVLEQHGWRVIGPVATVRGALRLLEDELPSVAVLDVNLGNEFVTPLQRPCTRVVCRSQLRAHTAARSASVARFWLAYPISTNPYASDPCWPRWSD